jgi:hypothetical protein
MEELIKELARIEGVKGVAIISNEGLIVTSILPETIDADAVAGMCATNFRNGLTTVKVLNAGKIKHILIETDAEFIIFSSLGNSFLATISDRNTNLGYLRIKIDKAVKEIKVKMLEE